MKRKPNIYAYIHKENGHVIFIKSYRKPSKDSNAGVNFSGCYVVYELAEINGHHSEKCWGKLIMPCFPELGKSTLFKDFIFLGKTDGIEFY